jgi:glycosyltransferase involved in cell wall biosynthesis
MKPRLLVLNQYYWPGVEATANLLSELCEALASEYDVTVVTGAVKDDLPSDEIRNGVRIIRVASTAYERSRLSRRAANYLTYVFGVIRHAFGLPRPDVVVCMTDPPFIGAVSWLVARRVRAPLVVISQDVFPEIAVQLGRLTNPAVIGVLRVLVNASMRHADRVVVIGDRMKRRLVDEKGVTASRIEVIPNWGDASKTQPAPRDNPWARKHKLVGRFVAMHFGNVGYAQDLDTLVRASTFLRDLDDLVVAIIGLGARREELSTLTETLEADAVRFFGWQPYDQRSLPISAADVHVVGLAKGLSGYVVPSRVYGVLAAGRPVIAHTDPDSETALLVEEVGCGITIPPGDPAALAEVLRACHDGEYDLVGMGRRARAFAEAQSDRSIAVARYQAVLEGVRSARR